MTSNLKTTSSTSAADTQLTQNFYLSEFTASQMAQRHNVNNAPPDAQALNLYRLAMMLEQVRTSLGGRAVLVSSGYRCPQLNVMVGGSMNSDHIDGRAADFTVPSFGSARLVAQAIGQSGIEFDQLIYEGTWVHISVAKQGSKPRGELLTAAFAPGKRARYVVGIV